ncbi:MAG: 4Fe-4S dicluster domain-containing protein [Candidatus Omnitrophica bacterium]|nr:4Fe-4S dicluster domain-containing protein [Candidatus Omnitrophota bacterium]
MNARFEEMRKLLDENRYFKLVCGAGNENAEEVRKLAVVYTLAGANGFDVSAKPHIVQSCVSGINTAYEWSKKLNIEIPNRPFITVSVGMPGDHHVRKAYIIDTCIKCDKCIPVCPTDAIPLNLVIIRDLCIGCGACEEACPKKIDAIRYEHDDKSLKKILPECLEAGAENIELHAAVPSNDQIIEEWKTVNEIQPNNFISMCLDRAYLSTHSLTQRIKEALSIAKDRTIIQADGVPMSGGKDDFNTTLQAIATTDIIRKNFKSLKILVSGGTNNQTSKLARMCGVRYNGISVGTHARKIVNEFLIKPDFDTNAENIRSAVEIGKELVHEGFYESVKA